MNKQQLQNILETYAAAARLYVPNFDLVIQFSEHEIFKNLLPNQEILFSVFTKAVNPDNNQKYLFSDLLDAWDGLFLLYLGLNGLSSRSYQRANFSTEIISKLQQFINLMLNAKDKIEKVHLFKEFKNTINETEKKLLENYPIYIRHIKYVHETLYLMIFLNAAEPNINLIEIFLWQILIDHDPTVVIPSSIIVSAVDNEYWFEFKGRALTAEKVAEAYVSEGLKLIQKPKLLIIVKPEARFTEAIKYNPKCKEAYYQRYLISKKKCDHLLAIQDLIKLKSLNPNDIMVYQQLAEHYLEVVFRLIGVKNAKLLLENAELALENINISIKYDNENAYKYYLRGEIYKSLKKPDFAIADFTQAIKLYPGYFKALIQRAEVYAAQGHITKALKDYEAALKIDPDSTSARIGFKDWYSKLHAASAETNSVYANQSEINDKKRKRPEEENESKEQKVEKTSEDLPNEEFRPKKNRYM